MSKKRTSSADRQTNGGSDFVEQDGDDKRARLGSWSERQTLNNLPIELIGLILIKVIVMEVKGLHLANSVWTKMADRVVRRLCTVCSHWSNILTTNFFRNELHRALTSDQEPIRFEMLLKYPIPNYIECLETIKDEIFLLIFQLPLLDYYHFDIYDRNNMALVKDVVPLPGMGVWNVRRTAACSVSNCLYLLNRTIIDDEYYTICRIARNNDNHFTIETVIQKMYLPHARMCVSPNGNLILVREQTEEIDAIIVCDANGNVLHTRRLPIGCGAGLFIFDSIIIKSNGNLVLDQVNTEHTIKLKEITMNGYIVRKHRSWSVNWNPIFCEADHNGRMLISDYRNRMDLIDSEFNLMEFSGPKLIDDQFEFLSFMRYNVNRNELVAITSDGSSQNNLLTIFRLS